MQDTSRSPTLADWGELKFLRWVRRVAATAGRGRGALAFGIGDDAAHLKIRRPADLLVTTDALIEGVHFERNWTAPRDLGFKSLAASLSDLAAMAAWPLAAFLSLGVPRHVPITELKRFFLGFRDEGRRWSCPLAGGDLVLAPQWVINVTLIGRMRPRRAPAVRSSARAGQKLFVTGRPGESAAGLEALKRGDRRPALVRRHNRPSPRLAEGESLAKLCADLAMIDLSDGLARDAGHLASESAVSIEIDAACLPLSRPLRQYARAIGIDPLDWALWGGEDYELLFTTRTPAARLRAAFSRHGLSTPLTEIGRVAPGRGLKLIGADGTPLALRGRPFEHFS